MEPEPPVPEDGEALLRIAAILREAKRVDFSEYRRSTIERRIRQRMAMRHVEDLDDYARLLEKDPDEVSELYERLLIPTTRFFRDPESFDVLRDRFLPRLFERPEKAGAIRVWSAGCSTGEEPYSLAILLLEAAANAGRSVPIHVFASDVSETALTRARAGAYPSTIAESVSAERLERFFNRSDGGYRVRGAVREICVFARHDLTQDPPFSHLDLVLCRNVLMFMNEELQSRVLDSLHYALRPDGILMLGRNEVVGRSASDLFKTLDSKHRIYGKLFDLEQRRPRHEPPPVPKMSSAGPATRAPTKEAARDTSWIDDAGRRLVAQRGAVSGVLVDERFRILRFYGHTGHYLERPAGRPTFDVLAMARSGLARALRAALVRALEEGRSKGEGTIRPPFGEMRRTAIGLEVVRLDGPPMRLLVMFHDDAKPRRALPARRRSK